MTFTFLGTKGGTGTTTMAVNCAANIQRMSGRSTLLVDARPGPGDVAVCLGLRPRYSLVDVFDQEAWRDPARVRRYVTEHATGVHVLASAESFGRPDTRDIEALEQTLRCCSLMYDVVVIDAGCALTAAASVTLAHAEAVLLVANPDMPCLRHLHRLFDALRLARVLPERMRILLNRVSEHGALPVSHIEAALNRPIDFQVPSDYRTAAAAMTKGLPIAALRPSDLQAALDGVARMLIGLPRAAAAS